MSGLVWRPRGSPTRGLAGGDASGSAWRDGRGEDAVCPTCGAERPTRGVAPRLSLGTVVAVVGGLALIAAFWMPWFAVQGLLLSGDFLARFLGNPGQLRQFAPALATNPAQAQALRTLVYIFPLCGAVAALLALVGGVWRERPGWLAVLLSLSGLVPLLAVLGGVTQLPQGASSEGGLWLLGIGSLAVLLGPWLDRLLARPARRP